MIPQGRSSGPRNRVALVTGGGSSLGAAFCRDLASRGATVIVADICLERAREVAISIGGHARYLDVADTPQVDELWRSVKAQYGSLDIVVNNAGFVVAGEALETPWEDWRRSVEVNLMGVVRGSLAALKIMKEQGSGLILNVASLAGLVLVPTFTPYSVCKAGVVSFSRSLAQEANDWGVHVAVCCPGNINTASRPPHISRLTPAVEPRHAARTILSAALKRKKIIVLPFYARLWWWIERLHPSLLGPARGAILRRARARTPNPGAGRGDAG